MDPIALAGNTSYCSQLNFTNMSCFKFDKHDFESIRWAKVGLSTVAGVMSCLALLLIIFLKAYKRFVHRLALYLTIIALLNAVAFALQVLPIKDECDYLLASNDNFCIAAGFPVVYSVWAILLLTCWITLHLFILAIFKQNYKSRGYEVGGVVITCFVIPVCFGVVPFIPFTTHGMMYGQAGAWCWIKLTGKHCEEFRDGLIEQFALCYGPVMFFVTLNFLAMLAVMIALYRGKKSAPGELQSQYKEAMKEALPLLFYPILFNTIFSLSFVNRVYYSATRNVFFPLWAAHAVADPCIPLFIPMAFLLHPSTLRKLKLLHFRTLVNKWRHHSQRSHTHFIVSKEDTTEEQRLIVGGATDGNTSGYQSFLDIQ